MHSQCAGERWTLYAARKHAAKAGDWFKPHNGPRAESVSGEGGEGERERGNGWQWKMHTALIKVMGLMTGLNSMEQSSVLRSHRRWYVAGGWGGEEMVQSSVLLSHRRWYVAGGGGRGRGGRGEGGLNVYINILNSGILLTPFFTQFVIALTFFLFFFLL